MNPIVKRELLNCRVAEIPEFSEDDSTLYIPKSAGIRANIYQIHKCYLVELEDYILNPPPDFTLSSNWNKGSIHPSKYMKVEIAQVMGKMVRIMGCGYNITTKTDMNTMWEGWVPQKGMKLIQQL